MSAIAATFSVIIIHLRAAIAAQAARNRAQTDLLMFVLGYLSRANARLQRLIAHWRAGTIPAPSASRPGRPHAPSTAPRLPSAYAWLVARVGYTAAGHGSQLQHLLSEPEWAEFLRAAPQASRILRPLCRMLAIPESLAEPAKPAAPRPAPEPPSHPPSPEPPPSDTALWVQPALAPLPPWPLRWPTST